MSNTTDDILIEIAKQLSSISFYLREISKIQSDCDPITRKIKTDYFEGKRDSLYSLLESYFETSFSEKDYLLAGLCHLHHEFSISTLKTWLNMFLVEGRLFEVSKGYYWFKENSNTPEDLGIDKFEKDVLTAFKENPFVFLSFSDLIRSLMQKCGLTHSTSKNRIKYAICMGVLIKDAKSQLYGLSLIGKDHYNKLGLPSQRPCDDSSLCPY